MPVFKILWTDQAEEQFLLTNINLSRVPTVRTYGSPTLKTRLQARGEFGGCMDPLRTLLR